MSPDPDCLTYSIESHSLQYHSLCSFCAITSRRVCCRNLISARRLCDMSGLCVVNHDPACLSIRCVIQHHFSGIKHETCVLHVQLVLENGTFVALVVNAATAPLDVFHAVQKVLQIAEAEPDDSSESTVCHVLISRSAVGHCRRILFLSRPVQWMAFRGNAVDT